MENDLIDFGMHLPRRAKYHDGQTKWVVKQAAGKLLQLLPPDIVNAPKRVFPMPKNFDLGSEALLRGGGARELLHWTDEVHEAMVLAARRDEKLRFLLVGLELWARLILHGQDTGKLATELMHAVEA